MGKSKNMRMITLFMAEKDLTRLDTLVSDRESPNRSEMIRFILKSFLLNHEAGLVSLPDDETILDIGAPEPLMADEDELDETIVDTTVDTIEAIDELLAYSRDEEDDEEDW